MNETRDDEPELSALERALLEAVPEAPATDAPIDDGQLAAFRRGDLDDDAAAALAGRLARDPAARALLVARAEAERGDETMSVTRVMAGQRAPRRRRWVAGAVAAMVALAAAIALFVSRSAAPDFALDGPYGGLAESRSEAGVSKVFVPGNRLRLFARPAAPLADPPGCLAVVEAGDGQRAAVDRRFVTVAANGVCRLDAPVEALFPTFGPYRVALIVVLDGPGAIPDGVPRLDDGIWLVEKIDYRSAEQP